MRPGIVTWNPFLKALLGSGQVPLPLMEVFWSLGMARSVMTGVRLGVFDALAEGQMDANGVAESIQADAHATTVLLNALAGFGYLHRKRGQYRLASQTRRWLLTDSPHSLVEVMRFLETLFQGIEPMEATIRSGQVENFHHQEQSDELWGDYVRGLGNLAKKLGSVVVKRVPVDGEPKRLLDIGGGHGMFSAAFCQRFPQARADILDLPSVLVHGMEMVEEVGLSDRIFYRAGDLRTVEWGEDYDVVFLFNLLHNLSAEECVTAIRRAFQALRPGGTVAVLDSQHEGGQDAISSLAGFNEFFFFLISGSQAWPEDKVRQWLEGAGFNALRRGTILPLPGLMMLTAQRPLAQERL